MSDEALRFHGFELDPRELALRRNGRRIPLEPKPFALLAYLIEHRDRVVPKGPKLGEVKSKASRRSVALPSEAIAALRRRRKRVITSGIEPLPTAQVFTDSAGGLLRRGNFGRRHWRPLRERAGLDGLRLHDLRHSAATLAIQAGTDPRTLQARLGHSSAAFTLQRYGHVLEDAQSELANRMDVLLKARK